MGAIGYAHPRTRSLSWPANRSRNYLATGFRRLTRESILRIDVLVESTSANRPGDRHREHARSAVAARRLDEYLHLQRRARGHVGRARLWLSTPLHHSLDERADRAARMGCEIFGRGFPATGSRTLLAATPPSAPPRNAPGAPVLTFISS